MAKITAKIDFGQMKARCLAGIADYESEGVTTRTRDGAYVYKDNGSQVLAVAHLDTVLEYDHFYALNIAGETLVYSAQLDDRLGAYVILDLLPKLNIKVDVLLTEGEESCNSTARHFQPTKEYNWVFSFDRAGDDTVLYQYDDKPTRSILEERGFRIGRGSYSDIVDLDFLGVKGFNFGVGYENNHSAESLARMSSLVKQVNRFSNFYKAYRNVLLPHAEPEIMPRTKQDDMRETYTAKYQRFECDSCHKTYKSNSDDDNCIYDYGVCTACYKMKSGEEYAAF